MSNVPADDLLATIRRLAAVADPAAAAAGYRQAVRDAYWDQSDVGAVTVLASAGISHCLTAAHFVTADSADHLRSESKALSYDLASFTWPGWGEPGIVIDDRDVRVGLDAAVMNLQLARDLDKGEVPLSRAQWMLGAQLMAAGRHSEASTHFAEAAESARRGEASAEAALADAFLVLSRVMAGEVEAERELEAALDRLRDEEQGVGLVGQVTTARTVLSGSDG